ncbi:MAG: histidine kinase [Thalassobius sp.]|nr:histidine kinase [Thalassovita sp.]
MINPELSPSTLKQQSLAVKALPFIICFLLPALNILNNRTDSFDFNTLKITPRWLFVSCFLLFLWFLNEKLSEKFNYFVIVIANAISIALLIACEYYIFPDFLSLSYYVSYWNIATKLGVASALFLTIQYTIKSSSSVERLKSENYLLKSENYKAQLEQLKKQVNPHFLFNSLSTLRTMIRANSPNSEDFVLNLSDVYRQILQTRKSNTVSLKEEIMFLNAYLYLIKVRHEDALITEMDIKEEALAYDIPVFALQLLVENCIKHNIVSESKPLHIKIYQQDETSISVSNNFQPKKRKSESLGVGLSNLQKRYELIGISKGIEIIQENGNYTVTLKLF